MMVMINDGDIATKDNDDDDDYHRAQVSKLSVILFI